MRVKLTRERFYFLLTAEDGRTVIVQTDWDYPGVARDLGWQPCECGATDGTIDCAHHTASEMIASAREYLDDHDGESFEDPGYFSNEGA